MVRKHAALLMLVGGILLWAIPALAHHSIASEFDFDKQIELTGVLTRAFLRGKSHE